MMSLGHLRKLLGNCNIAMSSQSVRMNLNKGGREETMVKVNGILRGQGLRMKMRKKIWYHKRRLMQLDRDMIRSSNIEVLVPVSWSVGHVERSTLRDIFHKIRVLCLTYIVRRRHKMLEM